MVSEEKMFESVDRQKQRRIDDNRTFGSGELKDFFSNYRTSKVKCSNNLIG